MPELLIVEDDPIAQQLLTELLSPHYKVFQASNGAEALRFIHQRDISLVLLDLMLGPEDGLDLLPKIKEFDDMIEIVILTGVRDVKTIVKAMRLGAFDYVLKDSPEELEAVLERAQVRQKDRRQILYLSSELEEQVATEVVKSRNPEMKALSKLLRQVAPQKVTVLIQGESGTGKEVIARTIHQWSSSADRPFVTVSMAAIPGTLMESLLFGHEKGAFTGADSLQRGKFELANGGTLFLDEIGDLPLELQPKLLRVLEEGKIERLGGSHTVPVDVRLIAASSRDLEEMVARGEFREELYYRLYVIPIKLPPLRERKEDISHLARRFFTLYGEKFGKTITGISKDVIKLLEHYPWPGNVRELEHLCERIAVTTEGPIITMKDLPSGFGKITQAHTSSSSSSVLAITNLNEAMSRFEKTYLEAALKDQDWHQKKTAELLGIHRKTLEAKMKRYGLAKQTR